MEGEAPKGGQWTAAMPQYSYTDLEEKLARAQRERDEALEQQQATAEVLRVISSSPGDLQPVFNAMLANATRLCEASYGLMLLCERDAFRSAAVHGPLPPTFIEQWRTGTLCFVPTRIFRLFAPPKLGRLCRLLTCVRPRPTSVVIHFLFPGRMSRASAQWSLCRCLRRTSRSG